MEVGFYIILILLWLLSHLLIGAFIRRYKNPASSLHCMPSPPALPIIGHLYLIGPLVHRSLQRLSNRYGPLLHLSFAALGSIVVVSSPSTAREFLKSHELSFTNRPYVAGSEYTGEETTGFTFTPYGPYWRFMKKLSVTQLFSTKKLEQSAKIRKEEIQAFLGSLYQKSRCGEPTNMKAALTALTNNIISRMLMSERCSGSANEAEECRKAVAEILELTSKLNMVTILGDFGGFDLFGYRKRLKIVHAKLKAMMEKIMTAHEDKEREMNEMGGGEAKEEDFMDILLAASRDEGAEVKISRDNVRAFLVDIFVAGTESSTESMQWVLAELINNPSIFKKARQEVENIVGKSRAVEEFDIPNLPYIQAVIKETLRLHPTAPIIVRECNQDCTVAGFNIPKGTKLFVNAWVIGRDPSSWEAPLEFRPERFLNQDDVIDTKGHHFQFLPFGSGRRVCLGASLALRVMHVTVALMVQCFDWKLQQGVSANGKIDMKEAAGFTIRMAQPIECIPTPYCYPFVPLQLGTT